MRYAALALFTLTTLGCCPEEQVRTVPATTLTPMVVTVSRQTSTLDAISWLALLDGTRGTSAAIRTRLLFERECRKKPELRNEVNRLVAERMRLRYGSKPAAKRRLQSSMIHRLGAAPGPVWTIFDTIDPFWRKPHDAEEWIASKGN